MSVLWIQEGRMFRQGQPDGSDSLRESPTFPARFQERQKVLQEARQGMTNGFSLF